MCIIAYKSPEATLNEKAIKRLDECFSSNPDGAGFMFMDDERPNLVRIEKGFMTFDSLKEAIERHKLAGRDEVVFHFRIASGGVVGVGNCHPFPVTHDNALLAAPSSRVAAAIVHNGVINSAIKLTDAESDTRVFVRDWLAPAVQPAKKVGRAVDVLRLLAWFRGFNKFATMTSSGVELFGEFHEVDKWEFSNYSYLAPIVVTKGGKKDLSYAFWHEENDGYDAWKASQDKQYKCSLCSSKAASDLILLDASLGIWVCNECDRKCGRDGNSEKLQLPTG